MTKLEANKTLVRETAVLERGDPIVIELHPRYMELRLKGKRAGLTIDYDTILDLARKLAWRRNGGRSS